MTTDVMDELSRLEAETFEIQAVDSLDQMLPDSSSTSSCSSTSCCSCTSTGA